MAAVRRDFHIWVIIIVLVLFILALFFSPSFRGNKSDEEEKKKSDAAVVQSSDEIMKLLREQQEASDARMRRLEERQFQAIQQQSMEESVMDEDKMRAEMERRQKELAIASSPMLKVVREGPRRNEERMEAGSPQGLDPETRAILDSQREPTQEKKPWRKIDDQHEFLNQVQNSYDNSVNFPVKVLGKTTISQGTIIPAVLVTEISSDNPGMIVAEVIRDVYDSIAGKYLLIPKGSRLIGQYMSNISIGQERLLAAFNRLIFPNGNSIDLSSSGAAEGLGAAGLKDRVNNHFWKIFGSSFIIAAIGYGADYAEDKWDKGNSNVNIYTGGGNDNNPISTGGQVLEDVAETILDRNKDIPPTIEIRSGKRFLVLVQKDLYIPVEMAK